MNKKHHHQQQQSQQQQQQQFSAGNDDLLPTAPPAFPQPVSSLPRDEAQQYYAQDQAAALAAAAAAAQQQFPAGMLPISSSAYSYSIAQQQQLQQQQQQQAPWGASAAAAAAGQAGGVVTAHYSNGVPYPAANGVPAATGYQQGPGSAAAAAAAPYGYGLVDGMPYEAAMAPYAAVYGGRYGSDAAVPLLTGGFVADMVFANRQMRHAFLRKVLCLVTIQLLLTAAIAAPLHMNKACRHFLHANPWVFGLTVIVTTTVLLVMAWSESARRRHPTNQLLLLLFTAANGLLVGTASATYSTQVLLLGVLIAATVSLALIAYASQISVDFTASGGILYSAVVVLLAVTLANWFLGFKTLHLLIGGCGALLFSAYLVYDVQLLAAGESCYQVSADEYVFAAINVYTDVITLFMYILQIIVSGGSEDE